jgi:carboxypeptidase Taq
MDKLLNELKTRLNEIYDLRMASELLSWDQHTHMPAQGARARGRQRAILVRIAQEKFIDKRIGELLDKLEPLVEHLPYESYEASLVRVTRRQYERTLKVPPQFMGMFYQHTTETFQVWAKARPENDFRSVQPYLERMLDLSRQMADFFPGYDHIADPLIDIYDFGMKADQLRRLFADLRTRMVPLVEAITAQEPLEDGFLHHSYSATEQLKFSTQVAREIGYDFERGRLDLSPHPFTTKFSLDDVRITTRVKEHDLNEALFSSIHEAGHAMYEQGIDRAFEATPLGKGTSAGVHESQSRLWENIVGRSRGFWEYFLPVLKEVFPEQLSGITVDTFYRGVNKVQPSLIRTDADEVTYNLHVMLRFDLELEMLEGKLAIKDLPEAWHARYEQDLGVRAPDDRDGVLQDAHWYDGFIGGAFQGYTLGNIIAAQFYESALQAQPEITQEIRKGKFATLHGWLVENIYQHGSRFTTHELLERVTGSGLSIEPYLRYMEHKFGELYGLNGGNPK